jgi:2-dehydropantoate 2-reductase
VGGHLAARLAAAGTDVSAIARGPHGQAIRERGLVLLRGDERLCVRPRCVEDPRTAAAGHRDRRRQGTGLPRRRRALAVAAGAHTRVVFAMNGIPWWFGNGGSIVLPPQLVEQLDPGRQLRDALHPDQIVGCVVYSSNVVIEPGVIRNMTPQRNRMLLGRPDGGSDALLEDFAALLAHAGIRLRDSARHPQLLWHKMLLIVRVRRSRR